ncbi:MAG: class I SAM-dependent methyltransferase [Candidatus Omnitrophota bacterium]
MQTRKECNICQNNEFKLAYRFNNFNVIRCLKCDTLCRDIIFDKEESKNLYAKDYFCDLQEDYFFKNIALRQKAFQRKVSIINSLYPQKGRLLDLGCATGLFVKEAVGSGWDAEGVEFSEFAARHAKEIEGLNVRQGDLMDMHYPAEHFDVVTMWDMVDHSEFPKDIVNEVYRILKPGGIVAMDTFMEDGIIFLLANYLYKMTFGLVKYPSAKGHPLHHSHYFSTKTFKNLLGSSGFEIILEKEGFLEAEIVSLNPFEKQVVSVLNWFSTHIGKQMEMLIVGKKKLLRKSNRP